jgi:hypothetical protein
MLKKLGQTPCTYTHNPHNPAGTSASTTTVLMVCMMPACPQKLDG